MSKKKKKKEIKQKKKKQNTADILWSLPSTPYKETLDAFSSAFVPGSSVLVSTRVPYNDKQIKLQLDPA